ncbi:hypothetical protein J6Q66_05305 [bacterium]|nr:hypothetical protein [bacterium]
MEKKFAIVLVDGAYGIFNQYDYGTCWSKVRIIFESDSYAEICKEFKLLIKSK